MAPAAKLKQSGKHCKIQFENKIVKKPNIGSTIPDKEPIKNALCFEKPLLFKGKERMAPSGKFCIAIPMDKAKAGYILPV